MSQLDLSSNQLSAQDTTIVMVSSVNSSSPANMAGFLPGDRLLLVNEVKVDSFDAVKSHTASAEGMCKVLRDGQQIDLSFSKPSANAALGITVKAGMNNVGIADVLRVNGSLTSVRNI